jgi:hypothetical protein
MAINTLGLNGAFPTTHDAPYSGASMNLSAAQLTSVTVRSSGAFELCLRMRSDTSVTDLVVRRGADGSLSTSGAYANASGKSFQLPSAPLSSEQARAVLDLLEASSAPNLRVPKALLTGLTALAKQ